MRYDLPAMVKRSGATRRKSVGLPAITPTKALEDALGAIYLRVVRAWAENAKATIVPAYSPMPTADGLTRDDAGEISSATERAEDEINSLILELQRDLRTWVLRMEAWHRDKWRSGVLSKAGIDLSTILGPEDVRETVQALLERNAALVQDVSDQIKARITDAVWRGYTGRKPVREVAKEINDAVQLGRKRSIRIASDQTVKLSGALDDERRRQAGVDVWIWRHSGKLHPREDHKARDGKKYTDKTRPADMPGELPFCGCKQQAWIDLD